MKTLLTILVMSVMMMASSQAKAAQCSVELQNGRGMVLDSFRSYGYDRIDACQEAKRDCRRAIRAGYYRGRNLFCLQSRPMRRMVTKSCTARLTGPRAHRTIQTFLGQARGQRGMQVKQQACRKAMKQCRRYKERNGRYRAQCYVDRQLDGPPRRSTPRRTSPRRTGRRLVVLDA